MKKWQGYGWTGYIAHIFLDSLSWQVECPDRDFYEQLIGGRGMGGYFLGKHCLLDWDDPQMPLCLFSGPLVATACPGSGRTCMMSISPLTGCVGDASLGGRLGILLRRAGWDGLVITGKSPYPVGIEIRNHDISFVRADSLWGKHTDQVYRDICPNKAALVCIGPAGENLVRFAAVCGDRYEMAARTGMGACFGIKKLKYILVSGTGIPQMADPGEFQAARTDTLRLIHACPALMGPYGFHGFGTGAIYDLTHSRQMMPTDNFQTRHFDRAQDMNASACSRTFSFSDNPCPSCPVHCKKISFPASSTGKGWENALPIPDFDAMSHFSALVGCTDLNLVVQANKACFALGMDPVSTAGTLACHREITGEEYGEKNLVSFIQDIAHCRDRGKNLALGAARYARIMRQPEAAMTVKSLEIPAYDPRGAWGMALGMAVSTRGACYLRGNTLGHEIFRKPVATNRLSFTGKARIVKIAEDLHGATDSLGICPLLLYGAGLGDYARMFQAVTGINFSAQDLLDTGERIVNKERWINAQNGFSQKDDDLPCRFFSESADPLLPALDREEFLRARQKYYALRSQSENRIF